MKGKFKLYPNLMGLEETLKEHKDYCLLAVSTTGVAETDEAIRVCAFQYTYDEATKSYERGYALDELIKADDEAVQAAIQRADAGDYDCFTNGGIDKEAYLRGDGVLTPAEFKNRFDSFMKSLDDNTLIIANNAAHCLTFLDRLDCAEKLQEMDDDDQILCQNKLSVEYFSKTGIPFENKTLETLRDAISSNSKKGEKIIGADNRLNVINSFIGKYGRDYELLEDELVTHALQEDQAIIQSMSEKGKEEYAEGSLEEKVETLKKPKIKGGCVDAEKLSDRDSDCTYNHMLDAFERKNGIKGIIVFQAATTGLTANDDPIQFCAIACPVEDGRFQKPKAKDVLVFDIQADEKNIAKAEQAMHAARPFDAFAYTGIDLETYKAGKDEKGEPLKSHEEAAEAINAFLKAHADFALVSSGSSDNGKSYAQNAFEKNGFEPFEYSDVQKSTIDFAQYVKEYVTKCLQDDVKNVIIDTERYTGKGFGLQDIAKFSPALKEEISIDSTYKKVQLMIISIMNAYKQQTELNAELYAEISEREKKEKEAQQAAAAKPSMRRWREDEEPDVSSDHNEDDVLRAIAGTNYVLRHSGQQGPAESKPSMQSPAEPKFSPQPPVRRPFSSQPSEVRQTPSSFGQTPPRVRDTSHSGGPAEGRYQRRPVGASEDTQNPFRVRDEQRRLAAREPDNSGLMRVIERQMEMMNRQMEMMNGKDAQVAVLTNAIAETCQSITNSNRQMMELMLSFREEEQQRDRSVDLSSPKSIHDAINGAKELISAIGKEAPDAVRQQLDIAASYLTRGQKQLEDKPVERNERK